jgi:hypothetical protein
MKTLITICIAAFLSLGLSAQDNYEQETNRKEKTLFNNGGIRLTGLWGGTTNGFVKFQNDFSLNNGGYFVFEINENFLVGWSGYGSGTELADGTKVDIDGNDLLLGYTFDSNNAIHPAVYLKGGSGSLEIEGNADDNVSVIEPSIGVELNVFRFMRIGIDGGYRFVNGVDTAGYTDQDFSSAFIGLRLKFGYSW